MPRPYSKDFREKVISHVKKGASYKETCIKFDISINTVWSWNKRYREEGHCFARKVGGKKGRLTKELVDTYVKSNPNFILSDMGKHFNMTAEGAHYWLKKLGYRYKKKATPSWKQAQKRG